MEDSQFETPEAASTSIFMEDSNISGFKVLTLKVPARSLPLTFLTLPLEIRRKIYTHALSTQIAPHYLRHVAHCPYRSRNHYSEPPPFIHSCLAFPAMRHPPTMEGLRLAIASCKEVNTHRCSCAKRHHGLDLLLACRKIYREAVGIFYSENTFYFTNGHEFEGFYESTRPKLRDLIKSISIWSTETLWCAILGLKGLKNLKIMPEHLSTFGPRVLELWKQRDVGITIVLMQRMFSQQRGEDWLRDIWIKVEEPLEKRQHAKDDKAAKAIQDQSEWFKVTVEKCQVAARAKLDSVVDENRKNLNLTLDSMELEIQLQGSMATRIIELLGLPNTNPLRVQLAKEERDYNADRITRGLRTRVQEEVHANVQERQKNEAALRLAEEEFDAQCRENGRIFNRKWVEERRVTEEERLRGARKKEIEGRRKSALGYREKERRRVPSLTQK